MIWKSLNDSVTFLELQHIKKKKKKKKENKTCPSSKENVTKIHQDIFFFICYFAFVDVR